MSHQQQSVSDLAASIDDLQMCLTYQDDDIKALNLVITRQQAEIEQLRTEMVRLKDLVGSMGVGAAGPKEDESPPPHY